jgi:Recombinase
MTTLILRVALANCGRIELDPARQKGKGGPPNGQKTMAGFPAWEDSSSSTEPLAAPRSAAGPAPRGQVAKRRDTPVPTDRSRNCFPKQSSPYIGKVQYTVLFVLGLKGTMSEAELHVLRARLQGGIRSKAQRGELFVRPPMGFVYDPEGKLVLDPDQQVQKSVRMLFETFRRTGSATATIKSFADQGLKFPRRVHSGPNKGEVVWAGLEHSRALRILHNPRYTGAFVYGRTHTRKTIEGECVVSRVPREEWEVLIREAHAGYHQLG